MSVYCGEFICVDFLALTVTHVHHTLVTFVVDGCDIWAAAAMWASLAMSVWLRGCWTGVTHLAFGGKCHSLDRPMDDIA